MRTIATGLISLCAVFQAMHLSASAATVPFEESFATGTSNWKNTASANPTYVATGGSDGGGYIQTTFAFTSTASTTPVLFRGYDGFDASGDAFVGDWIAEDVTKLTAFVRHNAPQPLSFFTRHASSASFPGAVAVDFVPVLPNTWTKIEFDTVASSPQFVSFEGSDFPSVFSNIGNVQIGVSKPSALASDTTLYTYELDQVSIVPEPASWLLALEMAAGGLFWHRSRAAR